MREGLGCRCERVNVLWGSVMYVREFRRYYYIF